MAITFNNIPDSIRTPGTYVEIDNSRALKGLVQNPHKVLIIGQKLAAGTAAIESLMPITRDDLADGYFGTGSILARMCNVFKDNNPNTELYALALSVTGGVVASAGIQVSNCLYSTAVSGTGTWNLMVNGVRIPVTITSGMSAQDVASAAKTAVNTSTYSHLPLHASLSAKFLMFSAVQSGTCGNYLDVRWNYYDGESNPTAFSRQPSAFSFADGATDPTLDDAWAVIDGTRFNHIIHPYRLPATNLTSIEGELADRATALEDMMGHGYLGARDTQANLTTLGNGRNSPYHTIIGAHDSPTSPEEWGAAWGAVAAKHLEVDPARPLQYLALKGVLPPPQANRFTRAERDTLLYDGIATWIVDSSGQVMIERSITTYQSNALGIPDPSYLDIETLFTLAEIRYQYKTRMTNRFVIPRFKLADDTFSVQPGSNIVTPKTIRQEIIALFTLLQDEGLIENLSDFIDNLVVERNTADRNRVDVLLPPDLINQFRILASVIQFIL